LELAVWYKGKQIGNYITDLLIEDRVIVELTTVSKIEPIHSAQVINYLKASKYGAGLLINVGNPKIKLKRLFNNIQEKKIILYILPICVKQE